MMQSLDLPERMASSGISSRSKDIVSDPWCREFLRIQELSNFCLPYYGREGNVENEKETNTIDAAKFTFPMDKYVKPENEKACFREAENKKHHAASSEAVVYHIVRVKKEIPLVKMDWNTSPSFLTVISEEQNLNQWCTAPSYPLLSQIFAVMELLQRPSW